MRALAVFLLLASPALAAEDCDDLRKMERSLSSTRTDDLIAKYNIPLTEGDREAATEAKAARAPVLAIVRDRLKGCTDNGAQSSR